VENRPRSNIFEIRMALTLNPRDVPVVGVDSHLPPVPLARLTEAGLRAVFAAPPLWQPEVVREPKFAAREPAAAAVLVPLVMRERTTLLLTQRTAHLSTHSGQVAFPGGRVDAEDADAVAAAKREAWEEVGLPADHVEVLGTLPTYVTGTSFIITPVVALVRPGFELRPNPGEVAAAFEVPLDFIMNPAHHRQHEYEWEGQRRRWFSMPYDDDGEERYIWGATAGMLRNFYRLLSADLAAGDAEGPRAAAIMRP
jgi:8-oxo-dGTP pyrophosphatase MutT (NUDIX family)